MIVVVIVAAIKQTTISENQCHYNSELYGRISNRIEIAFREFFVSFKCCHYHYHYHYH